MVNIQRSKQSALTVYQESKAPESKTRLSTTQMVQTNESQTDFATKMCRKFSFFTGTEISSWTETDKMQPKSIALLGMFRIGIQVIK